MTSPTAAIPSKPVRKQRNSSVELLRIIAMLMIVAYHFMSHNATNIEIYSNNIPNYMFLFVMYNTGKIGVVIFFTITSWYFIDKKQTVRQSLRRVWLLERELIFWGIVSFLFCRIVDPSVLGRNELQYVWSGIRSVMPVTFIIWWYITCYMIFLLVLPFLQQGLIKLGRRKHCILGLLLLIVFGVTSLIPQSIFAPNTMARYVYDTPLTFLYLFVLISAYKLYFRKASTKTLVATLLVGIAISAPYYVLTNFLMAHGKNVNCQILGLISLPTTIIGVAVFLLFERWHWHNRAINFIAKSTLAVYLITEYGPTRIMLWSKWFNVGVIETQSNSALRIVVILLGVFTVCVLLDFVRRGLFAAADRRPGHWFDLLWERLRLRKAGFVDRFLLPQSETDVTHRLP